LNQVKTLFSNVTDQAGYQLARMWAKMTKQDWNMEPPKWKDPPKVEWNLKPPEMGDLMAGLEDIPKKIKWSEEQLDRDLAALSEKRLAREKQISDLINKHRNAKPENAGDMEKINVARAGAAQLIKDEIALLKEKMAAAKEAAAKTIEGILAENKAKEDAAKQDEKDAKKAERLWDAKARGIRLGKGEEEWLDARNQIVQARQALRKGGAQLGALQQQAIELKMQPVVDEIADLRKDIKEILQR
jgi:hypothetical protein